jgi:hypothetical protein
MVAMVTQQTLEADRAQTVLAEGFNVLSAMDLALTAELSHASCH